MSARASSPMMLDMIPDTLIRRLVFLGARLAQEAAPFASLVLAHVRDSAGHPLALNTPGKSADTSLHAGSFSLENPPRLLVGQVVRNVSRERRWPWRG